MRDASPKCADANRGARFARGFRLMRHQVEGVFARDFLSGVALWVGTSSGGIADNVPYRDK